MQMTERDDAVIEQETVPAQGGLAHGAPGEYFNPSATPGAVTRTLLALQRACLLRSCGHSVCQRRTRACLLYQIKRCSAPGVGRIDKAGYDRVVEDARGFLSGQSKDV